MRSLRSLTVGSAAAAALLIGTITVCQLPAQDSTSRPRTPSGSGAQPPAPQPPTSQPATPPADSPFESLEERAAYAVGLNMGRQIKALRDEGVALDPDVILRGMRSALGESEALLDDAQVAQTLRDLNDFRRELRVRKQAEDRQRNLDAGEAFLVENAKKEGVVTRESGLQYRVVQAGTGPSPEATDAVRFHYTGKKIDGSEFESSRGGAPLERPLTALVKGWQEALPLMKKGAVWELYLPANLAYGDGGRPPLVGPGETIIYEIELLEVVPRGVPK